MSNSEGKKLRMLEVEATLGTVAVAASQIIMEDLPKQAELDGEAIATLVKLIRDSAKATGTPAAQEATKLMIKEFGGEKLGSPAIVTMLEGLMINQRLLEEAVESIKDENHDDTDLALTAAIDKVFDLDKGIGAPAGNIGAWIKGGVGTAMANAVGFAAHLIQLLEKDDEGKEKLAKLVALVAQSLLAEAPEAVKATIGEAGSIMGNNQAILMLWALFIGGISQGVFMGWRAHEVAIVATTHSIPLTSEK